LISSHLPLPLTGTEPDKIVWSPSGKYYAVLLGTKVEVFDDVRFSDHDA
jgi:hypothetical protein